MTVAPHLLTGYVCRQLENHYPDGHDSRSSIETAMPRALERVRHLVGHVIAWKDKGFDPLWSGQYCTFLYLLGNEVWRSHGDSATATRLFLLNKALHGIELFHEVPLPEVFLIGHTTSVTFAKARYGTHLVFHQNCTVGHKLVGERPVLEDRIVMFPNSMVIGKCHIRSNTVIAPGVVLVDTDTPGDCYVVAGPNGKPTFKVAKRQVWKDYFV